MSLPKLIRACFGILAFTCALALSGCTLTPVYGGGASDLALAYSEPVSRLDQIAYRALSARLGTSTAPDAALATLGASASSSAVGLTTMASPVRDYQVVASVSYTVMQGGIALTSGTRTATAGYQTTGQIVADNAAEQKATEQAVIAATEAVRLAIIAELAGR